jgi:hypothetical protein
VSVFEIYLLKDDEKPLDADSVANAFFSDGRLQLETADPTRGHWRDPDTGAFLTVGLAVEVVAALHRKAGRPFAHEEQADGEAVPGDEERASAFEEEEEEEGEDDDGAPLAIETAPVVLSVPLLTMTFFAEEAIALASRIAEAAGLRLEHHAEGEAAVTAVEDLLEAWDGARRHVVDRIVAENRGYFSIPVFRGESLQVKLCSWSAEKAAQWQGYGALCRTFAAELASKGVAVPRLEVVRHGDAVKSHCAWTEGTATVLPRSDLVLVRRERERRGFLRTRRVTEEGFADGEQLWKILAPWSEVRTDPADHLLFTKAASPPRALTDRLESLPLEPLDRARRATLLGVVDCDVPA